jgi:hypothetical protein
MQSAVHPQARVIAESDLLGVERSPVLDIDVLPAGS